MNLAIRTLLFCAPILMGAQTRDLKIEPLPAGSAADRNGSVRALVVGISQYKFLPDNVQLRFAHRDAEAFAGFLKTASGGGLPSSHLQVLTNENATLANLRTALTSWLPRVTQPNDIVYLFFAGHGTVENDRDGYFVAHDSDPQNLYATALSFDEIESMLKNRLRARHVILIADACHSGQIGWVDQKFESARGVNRQIENLARGDKSVLQLLASRGDERSYEDARWGGGHGVFSYSLLEGLRGRAEKDGDRLVRASELIEYVSRSVERETGAQQHPRVAGSFEPALPLSIIGLQATIAGPTTASSVAREIDAALARALVIEKDGAADLLLKMPLSDPERAYAEMQVISALEAIGQRGVSDYVDSNTPGLKASLLLRAAAAYSRLRQLKGDTPELKSKQAFSEGRAKLLMGDAKSAIPLLELAVQLDPKTACPVNALGVAYERTGDNKRAMEMFQKAAQLTPAWALPRIQMASQLQIQNRLEQAARELDLAVRLQPRSVQARWLQTRVYRLLGRFADADRAGRALIQVNPNYAPVYSELGQVYEAAGQPGLAVEAYNNYLQLAPNFVDSVSLRQKVARLKTVAAPTPVPQRPRTPPTLRREDDKR